MYFNLKIKHTDFIGVYQQHPDLMQKFSFSLTSCPNKPEEPIV